MGSSFELLALPARIVPAARMSDEEFLAFCAANEPYQFEINEKGEILVMTPSRPKGGNLEGYVFRELDLWAERAGKGLAVNSNTIFGLPDTSLRMPDAAWISSDLWDSLTPAEQEKLPHFCPEFVVEVRSPSDRAAAVEKKMGKWMANGARLGWLIDPVRKLAMVYRLGVAAETLVRPEFLVGEGPVDGFRLKMGAVLVLRVRELGFPDRLRLSVDPPHPSHRARRMGHLGLFLPLKPTAGLNGAPASALPTQANCGLEWGTAQVLNSAPGCQRRLPCGACPVYWVMWQTHP